MAVRIKRATSLLQLVKHLFLLYFFECGELAQLMLSESHAARTYREVNRQRSEQRKAVLDKAF